MRPPLSRALALALALLLSGPPAGMAAPAWRGLDWGITAAEAAARLGGAAERVAPPRPFGGGLSAPLRLPGARIGAVEATAWLQTDAQGRLVQILFRPDPPRASSGLFARILRTLRAGIGPEARLCRGAGAIEAVWDAPAGRLHAVFLPRGRVAQIGREPGLQPPEVETPEIPEGPEMREEEVGPDRPPEPGRRYPNQREPGDPPEMQPIPRPDFPEPEMETPEPRVTEPTRSRAVPPGLHGRIVLRLHDPGAAALASPRCPLPR